MKIECRLQGGDVFMHLSEKGKCMRVNAGRLVCGGELWDYFPQGPRISYTLATGRKRPSRATLIKTWLQFLGRPDGGKGKSGRKVRLS